MSLHIKPEHIFRAISVLKRSRQFRISLVEYKSLFSWRRPWCRCRRCFKRTRGRQLLSMIKPTVHTNPTRKQSFSKILFKLEEFQHAGLLFWCGRKTFWKQSFGKRWRHNSHVITLTGFSQINADSKWPVIVLFSNWFSGVVWRKTFDGFSECKTEPFSNFVFLLKTERNRRLT